MIRFLLLLPLTLLASPPQDFKNDLKADAEKAKLTLQLGQRLLLDGKLDKANAGLLELFPEATRTPSQSFLLGNLIWATDPKLSYALHKAAVEKLPDEADPQLEWAMEQHRRGEYKGAAEAYAKYSAAVPEYAVAWGLAADCLARLGRDRDAVKAWQSSESAKQGSLESFESMVCEIHRESIPVRERSEYLKAVAKGDADAAVALIALDAFYPLDWWNTRANKDFLKRDMVAVHAVKFVDPRRLEAIECTAAVGPLSQKDVKAVREALSQYRFLLDDDVSVPSDPKLAAIVIDHAVESGALGETRKKVADKVLAAARSTKNADLWNATLFLYQGEDQLALEKEAWEATSDARFAMGYLSLMAGSGTLNKEDAILSRALQLFPENGFIVRKSYDLAKKDGTVTPELLLQAIKAEFRHFSSTGMLPRPRAALLRVYFKELDGLLKK